VQRLACWTRNGNRLDSRRRACFVWGRTGVQIPGQSNHIHSGDSKERLDFRFRKVILEALALQHLNDFYSECSSSVIYFQVAMSQRLMLW